MIQTARLILRDFLPEDFDALHHYASDQQVANMIPTDPNTPEETRLYLQSAIRNQKATPRRDYQFAIVLISENRVVGDVCLHVAESHEGWISYSIDRKYWGNGYATEAGKAIMRFAAETLKMKTVFTTCDSRNKASARVLEKIGMRLMADQRGVKTYSIHLEIGEGEI